MNNDIFFNNLSHIKDYPLNQLTVSSNGRICRTEESRTDPELSKKLSEVIQNTYTHYQTECEGDSSLWAGLNTTDKKYSRDDIEAIFNDALSIKDATTQPNKKIKLEGREIVTLTVEGQAVNANRQLLSKASPMLSCLLSGKFKEESQNTIILENVNAKAFQSFVDFIEKKEGRALTDPNLLIQMCILGDYLQNKDFIEFAAKQLFLHFNVLDPNNLKELLMNLSPYLFEEIISYAQKESAEDLSAAIDVVIKQINEEKEIDIDDKSTLEKTIKNALIAFINNNEVPMRKIAGKRNPSETIEWLSSVGKKLHYADFSMFRINNYDLKKLTINYPNLKDLSISSSKISGDALKYLDNTQGLQSLDIFFCDQIERDAIKLFISNHDKATIYFSETIVEYR